MSASVGFVWKTAMKKPCSVYYWIMTVACTIPGIVLLALPNGTGRDWIFFALLFLSAVGFTVGVLAVNWKKRKGEPPR